MSYEELLKIFRDRNSVAVVADRETIIDILGDVIAEYDVKCLDLEYEDEFSIISKIENEKLFVEYPYNRENGRAVTFGADLVIVDSRIRDQICISQIECEEMIML